MYVYLTHNKSKDFLSFYNFPQYLWLRRKAADRLHDVQNKEDPDQAKNFTWNTPNKLRFCSWITSSMCIQSSACESQIKKQAILQN